MIDELRIPSLCEECNGVFVGLTLLNAESITIPKPLPCVCPYCGGRAYTAQGVWDGVNGVARLIAAPTYDAERLQSLLRLLEDAQAGRIPDMDAVLARIEKEDSALARYLRNAFGPQTLSGWLGVLIALVSLHASSGGDAQPNDYKTLNTAITMAVDQCRAQYGLPPLPAITKRPPPPPRKARKARQKTAQKRHRK